MADDLHESIAAVGLVASAYALPTALLAPLFGPLSDRRGRRFTILLGLTVFSVAAAACAVAPTLPLLLLARVVTGLGAAITLPATLALAGDLPTVEDRGRAISVVAAMFPLSTLLGLPIGALVAVVGGWRASFVLVLLVGIAAALFVYRFCRDRRAPAERVSYFAPYRTVFGDPHAIRIMVVTLVWFLGSFGLFVYVGEFIHRSFGIPSEEAGLVYVVVGVVGIAATRLSSRVIAGVGPRRAVLTGLAMFAIGATVLPLTAVSLPLAVAVFGFWAFGVWLGIPAQQTIVAGLSESARGTMLAFNTSFQNAGGVVGPALTGRVIEIGGFALAGPWTGLVGLTALVLAWFVLPRVERPTVAAAVGT